jgi:hypothetical protein
MRQETILPVQYANIDSVNNFFGGSHLFRTDFENGSSIGVANVGIWKCRSFTLNPGPITWDWSGIGGYISLRRSSNNEIIALSRGNNESRFLAASGWSSESLSPWVGEEVYLLIEDEDSGETGSSWGFLALDNIRYPACYCWDHSNVCDSITGDCMGCTNNTTGSSCGQCKVGYEGDSMCSAPYSRTYTVEGPGRCVRDDGHSAGELLYDFAKTINGDLNEEECKLWCTTSGWVCRGWEFGVPSIIFDGVLVQPYGEMCRVLVEDHKLVPSADEIRPVSLCRAARQTCSSVTAPTALNCTAENHCLFSPASPATC